MRRYAVQHPITALCVVAIGLSVPLQMGLLIAGLNVFPGKVAELLFLTGTAALITSWIGGRVAVRRLFSGITRWRIGVGRWAMLLLAMPALTLGVAAATGTVRPPRHGWVGEGLTYLLLFVLILLTASLWEETAWAGFVQITLMGWHGLLVGSLLTAIPFGLIHLPLAFEGNGWRGPPGQRPSSTGRFCWARCRSCATSSVCSSWTPEEVCSPPRYCTRRSTPRAPCPS